MFFLTGPVRISDQVKFAFSQDPISHRSSLFEEMYADSKQKLVQMTNAKDVILLSGSGTLANEAIGQQLKCFPNKGLILSNGEFGNRLKSQALSAGITYDDYTIPYGQEFDLSIIEKNLAKNVYSWIWMVVHETSTGIWNDFETISEIAKKYSCAIAVDAVSAFATKKIDLSNVNYASGSSGKAIGAYPGISIVWHNKELIPSRHTPTYLDLQYYSQFKESPFTCNSNLIAALHAALTEFDTNKDYEKIAKLTFSLKNKISDFGWSIVNKNDLNSNNVTISYPDHINSEHLGDLLLENNCWVGYKSSYLKKLNWLQFYITKNNTQADIDNLEQLLRTESFRPFLSIGETIH